MLPSKHWASDRISLLCGQAHDLQGTDASLPDTSVNKGFVIFPKRWRRRSHATTTSTYTGHVI